MSTIYLYKWKKRNKYLIIAIKNEKKKTMMIIKIIIKKEKRRHEWMKFQLKISQIGSHIYIYIYTYIYMFLRTNNYPIWNWNKNRKKINNKKNLFLFVEIREENIIFLISFFSLYFYWFDNHFIADWLQLRCISFISIHLRFNYASVLNATV